MNIQIYTLKNNSLLVVVNVPGTLSTTTMALIKAGPRYDPHNKEGLSHFIEHMLAKGSKKWPTSMKLTSILERKGASYNAFSYYETNRYWIKSSSDDIGLVIENLLDRLNFSLLREKDIETEKGVVKEESRIVQSNPEQLIWEVWSQTIWQGSDLGRIYIGNKTSIDSFSKTDTQDFMERYYTPERVVFVASGDFNPKMIYEEFNKHLGKGIKKKSEGYLSVATNPVKSKEKTIKIFKRETETITVALGFPTVFFGHEDAIPLELIGVILAGGMSSRLRQKVMEPGYTYSIEAYTEHLSDCGYLMVRFTTAKEYLNRVLQIIFKELKDLTYRTIDENELDLAKGYLSGSLKVNMETSFNWAKWFVDQYLLDPKKVLTPQEKIDKIKKIDCESIKRISRRYFLSSNLRIAILGKVEEKEIKLNY